MLTIELTTKRVVITLACLLSAAMVVALLIAYSGIYNIAASRGHPEWMNWFLTVGMRNSVEANSADVIAPPLNKDTLLPLGAAHFKTGCAVCHGAPDTAINPVFDHMLPSPPSLTEHGAHWQPAQLFWIIKHGFQFTGMPGWSGQGRDDEIWAVTAFVHEMPRLSEQDYVKLANGNAKSDANNTSKDNCARCHGTQRAASTSALVPRLGGQKQQYLLRSLREYKNNTRQSGIMEPLVRDLDDVELLDLARRYAALHEPARTPPSFDKALVEQGKQLAMAGDRDKRIAACNQCHGASASQEFPRLDGQHYDYLRNQLLLWRKEGRQTTAYGSLMGFVSKGLTDQQIDAVSAWYASRPAFSGVSP